MPKALSYMPVPTQVLGSPWVPFEEVCAHRLDEPGQGDPGPWPVSALDHGQSCSALRLSHLWTFTAGHSMVSCYLSYSISGFLGAFPGPHLGGFV